jgi:hypothetical protein
VLSQNLSSFTSNKGQRKTSAEGPSGSGPCAWLYFLLEILLQFSTEFVSYYFYVGLYLFFLFKGS